MKNKMTPLLVLCLLFSLHSFKQEKESAGLNIIPLPLHVETTSGKFTLPQNISVHAGTADEINVAGFLKEWLQSFGKTVTIGQNLNATVTLSTSTAAEIPNSEGYRLIVSEEGIKINASSGAGLFYGLQSMFQLVPVNKTNVIDLPLTRISDQPFFKWRGVMLDVSRHFFSVDFIKRYLDIISFYKINTFHWHLTDDQGWRIEIKKYPKLTEVAAYRKETLIGAQQLLKKPEDFKYDGVRYGGYYTQEQIR